MTRVISYLKKYKKIFIIISLIIALSIAALVAFGENESLTVTSSNRSVTEEKLVRILSEISGVGQAEVMITEIDGNIEGVIIVCEGAKDIMVKNDVINAVRTAFKVEKNNIAVYAMNK